MMVERQIRLKERQRGNKDNMPKMLAGPKEIGE